MTMTMTMTRLSGNLVSRSLVSDEYLFFKKLKNSFNLYRDLKQVVFIFAVQKKENKQRIPSNKV